MSLLYRSLRLVLQLEELLNHRPRSYADVSKTLEVLKTAENEMRTSQVVDQEMKSKYAVLLEMHQGCERTVAELR